MQHNRRWLIPLTLALAIAATCVVILADPPDSAINPQSGAIEIVDPLWNGTSYDVRYTHNPGNGAPEEVTVIADHVSDDLDARIALGPDGSAWVVWWRDGAVDEVLVRHRQGDSGSWSDESSATDAPGGARNPDLVHDGTDAWIAYETDGTSDTIIGACGLNDEPDPLGAHTTLSTTEYTGDLDVKAHAWSGHLWVTWIDSSVDVGFSKYDYTTGTWSLSAYESYAGDDVRAARSRIRLTVTGN